VAVSWDQALAMARRMLARLAVPPGARPSSAAALPVQLREPGPVFPAPPEAEVDRAYRLPQPVHQAFGYLLSHPPAGTRPGQTGSGDISGLPYQAVAYLLRNEPAGVWITQLVVLVAARSGGGSWLTAEAHVAMYRLSSAAERVPADLRVVTVTLTDSNSTPTVVARVINSAAIAARLAGFINQGSPPESLYGRPSSGPGCRQDVIYQLDFAAVANGPPAASATVDCGGIGSLTVHGIPAGPREDPDSKLFQALSALLPAPTSSNQ